jgi:hypothetical protein
MGSKNPTKAELAEKRRRIVNELPFTCPVEKDRKIEVHVQDNRRSKLEQLAHEIDMEVVEAVDGGSSQQGPRTRMTLAAE